MTKQLVAQPIIVFAVLGMFEDTLSYYLLRNICLLHKLNSTVDCLRTIYFEILAFDNLTITHINRLDNV